VLHQPREFLRAAVDVADDPSGHVLVRIDAMLYALERGTSWGVLTLGIGLLKGSTVASRVIPRPKWRAHVP
jgi:hypothetical protein